MLAFLKLGATTLRRLTEQHEAGTVDCLRSHPRTCERLLAATRAVASPAGAPSQLFRGTMGLVSLVPRGFATLLTLASLLGCAPLNGTSSYAMTVLPLDAAFAINTSGAIAGRKGGRAAIYAQGNVILLPGKAGYSDLAAADIADNGSIIGWGMSAGKRRGLFWSSTTAAPLDMGALGGQVFPLSINSQGVAVGYYDSPGPAAFQWSLQDGMKPIAPPSATMSQAFDISETGYIAGVASYPQPLGQQAMRWTPDGSASPLGLGVAQRARRDGSVFGATGTTVSTLWPLSGPPTPLGPNPGPYVVAQISAAGRMVGYTVAQPTSPRPWTTWQSSTPIDLPMPAGARGSAHDVNACGTILGNIRPSSGGEQWVIWSRISCDVLPPTARSQPTYPVQRS
jgi:uncharacterized membrane protein